MSYVVDKLVEHCAFNREVMSRILKVFEDKAWAIVSIQDWYVQDSPEDSAIAPRIVVIYTRHIKTAAGLGVERNISKYIPVDALCFDELEFASAGMLAAHKLIDSISGRSV